jgi:hypothetical protein
LVTNAGLVNFYADLFNNKIFYTPALEQYEFNERALIIDTETLPSGSARLNFPFGRRGTIIPSLQNHDTRRGRHGNEDQTPYSSSLLLRYCFLPASA